MKRTILLLLSLCAPFAAAAGQFRLSSPQFANGGAIPARNTCEGEDLAPTLRWSAPPLGTESLALVVDDPDAPDPAAPKRVWVHWVVYDLPADGGRARCRASRCPPARATAPATSARPAGRGRARRSAGTATSSSSTRWTSRSATAASSRRPRSGGRDEGPRAREGRARRHLPEGEVPLAQPLGQVPEPPRQDLVQVPHDRRGDLRVALAQALQVARREAQAAARPSRRPRWRCARR